MIEYPKIPSSKNFRHSSCFAFVKYDGTNVGFEWTKKRGFHKFRLRSRLFDITDKDFGPAIPLFLKEFSEPLSKLFVDKKLGDRIAIFGEFYGDATFAGNHYNLSQEQKENRKITIFDAWVYDYGFLGPQDFIDNLSNIVPLPNVVYKGKYTGQLVEDIRRGKYKDKGVQEGVILKAGKGGKDIEYAKVKTNEYLNKLKTIFGNNWSNYWE